MGVIILQLLEILILILLVPNICNLQNLDCGIQNVHVDSIHTELRTKLDQIGAFKVGFNGRELFMNRVNLGS